MLSNDDIKRILSGMQNDPNQVRQFLDTNQISPDRVATAFGPGGQQTVNSYVQQNPMLREWQEGQASNLNQPQGAQGLSYGGPTGYMVNGQAVAAPSMIRGNTGPTQLGMPSPQPQQMQPQQPQMQQPQQTQYNSPASPAGTPAAPQLPVSAPQMPQGGGQAPNPFGQMNGMTGNPYLQGMANNLTRTATNALQRQILPGIRGQAVAAGGVGGSRQGVAEGLAVGGTMDALGGALTNLYGNAYGQDQQYDLANQRIGLDTYNSNQNWMRLGQNDQLNALNTMMGWQGQGINAANQQQQTPLQNWQQFANTGAQLGGMGGTNSQTLQGNPWLGALGGMQLGTKLFGG